MTNYPEHIDLSGAWRILRENFADACRSADVQILQALDLILREDIAAARNVPHYAASAVDGYALDAGSTIGAAPAPPAAIPVGRYVWVNTGADLPSWSNAVLMVEDSSLDGDTLLVSRTLTPSANVRPLGEDVMAGQIIAREGEMMPPALMSLFLNAGLESAPVIKRPRVLFIPTGDEIIPRGRWLAEKKPRSGTVAESNSLFIEASFKRWGYEVDVADVLPYVPEILKAGVELGVKEYDVVLVGAGSAKGERDHTLEVFRQLGEVLFRWLRMKPGRPAMAAKIAGKPVICMPGFPMSTAVVLWSLVYPLLKLLSGEERCQLELVREAIGTREVLDTKLLVQHSSQAGIEEWLRVQTARIGDTTYSWALTSGASVLWALSESDGVALLPASALECEKNTSVAVWMTKRVDFDRRVLFQGSDDPAVQLLAIPVKRRGGDLVSRAVGSMGGLAALSRNECHIAASHLLDERDGSYNDSFIERFAAGRDWRRFLLFYRTQGIIVQAGNPQKIRNFEDLINGGCIFANRQPGAGTRVLFDYFLKQQGVPASQIKGYSQQCTTHMEAANRVYTGLGRRGVGHKIGRRRAGA